ncbi:Multicopper oxidase, type 1 [Dillenia turbinata]|uniref:Multicopper oxidase, type 1 n=1 Tax=Dillenia turbinata TaxID=194707 RepID=A0AAN8VKT3_9MAGN
MENWIRALMLIALLCPMIVESRVRHYKFSVIMKNTTRLCATKPIVTVNGKFPGPTIYAREDDTLIVRVINHVKNNVTIHWHGVRQFRTGWSDGPSYITQCPIQTGQSFIYNFALTGQRGTLLWHAHILWLRATVHGAIVILPKQGIPYPFPKPDDEVIIILAEWWKSDVEAVVNQATQTGLPPNISDAHTINGYPGPLQSCPQGHNLTLVEVDASYTKPFETDIIFIAPGQTTNALLTTNQKSGQYLIATSSFMDSPIAVDNTTATATLNYLGTLASSTSSIVKTDIPPLDATAITRKFLNSLRSLNSKQYPSKVPLSVDHSLFFTVSVGVNPCSTCLNGSRLVSAFNNVTFVLPSTALLQAHYYNISGVFTEDFPGNPPIVFNYTGPGPVNLQTMNGTKVYRLPFNASVQVVLQGTGIISPENHPTHLHGYNFFQVGQGLGNFDPNFDPMSFNLVDPVERNTIGVPSGGWTAIRFRADNPGVWFLHCHLEVHTTWGLKMAFLVENGKGPNESILPPPQDLPKC